MITESELTHDTRGALVETASYGRFNHDMRRNAAFSLQHVAVKTCCLNIVRRNEMGILSSLLGRSSKHAGVPDFNSRRQGPFAAVGAVYTVGDDDRVRRLHDLPQSNVGAPLPCIIASEYRLAVAYLKEDEDWDGETISPMSRESENEAICIVRFQNPRCHFLGPPNDEAFNGHPLAARGLEPYGSFVVSPSAWIRALEEMNSVHPYHKPEWFKGLSHYVLSFHDSTFECVATGYTSESRVGSLRQVAAALSGEL